MKIAIDFDGTIVEHEFPKIGKPVPGAFEWMKKFQEAGADLILWTMRSDGQDVGNVLTEAVEFCREKGIEFFGINTNPEQKSWTDSPKAYAQCFIDDHAFNCPLIQPESGRAYVDWQVVGPAVLDKVKWYVQCKLMSQ